MAVLTLYRALGSSTPPFIGTVSIAESDHLQLVAGTVTLDYYGFGLSYSEATVTGGTVTGYEVRNTAQAGLLFSVAGLNLAAATFFELARGGQPDAISATLFGGDDTLIGSPGADSLQGQGGSDSISGGAGNDTLVGNDDDLADTLAGGNGNDLYLVGAGGHGSTDVVVELEGGGIDRVESPTSYTLGANVEQLVLAGSGASTGTGNALANLLIGTGGDNTLDGDAGADTLEGGLGDDTYLVDNTGDLVTDTGGLDTVLSSAASYTLGAAAIEILTLAGTAIAGAGNAGANLVTGNDLDNNLLGLGGNDTLQGGGGSDTLSGGAGDDLYLVDSAGDVLLELPGAGTDRVQSATPWQLAAEIENLTLTGLIGLAGTGNALANQITGTPGNDTLDGGVGADTMAGGGGNDSYVVDNAADVIIEVAVATTADKFDLVQAWASYTLVETVELLTLMGTAPLDGTGSAAGGETLTGNDAANVLNSGGGLNDELYGMGGDDTLSDGGGYARMYGGAGNDTYLVASFLTWVIDEAGAGTDAVIASINYTLGNHLENLTLQSGVSGMGNALNNVIVGNGGSNFLDGMDGADTLTGGLGDDQYYVDNRGDVVVELDGQGYDSIVADGISVSVASLSIERIYLGDSASGNTNATGNALDNYIRGTNGDNVLDGAGGADEMVGWLGDDTFVVDNAGDQIFELANQGRDTVRSKLASFTLALNFENLALDEGAISGTGNADDNLITGNDSANSLDGREGADTLAGSQGNDTLTGGAGDDALDGDAGIDRAIYGGVLAGYTVTRGVGAVTVVGAEGTDVLVGVDEIAFSDQVVLLNDNQASGTVGIGGTLLENRSLAASASGVTDADGTGSLGWQWFRGETAIAGATSATYLLGASDVGASLRARARFVDGDGNSETLWSAATAAIALGDHIAPTAVLFTPADEATGVAVASNITLGFSEAVARGTGVIALRTSEGQLVESFDAAGSARLAFTGSTLTVDPTAPLAYGTSYRLEFAAGSVLDLDSNAYAGTGSYNFSTRAGESVAGSGGAESLGGTPGSDTLTGLGGNDTLAGGAGNDSLDGGAGSDTAVYTGTRASHTVSGSSASASVSDTIAGHDGSDNLVGVERLLFSDRHVDLTIAARAAALDAASLKTVEELYVGFFNRIPEADGLSYWIGQLEAGVTLENIANQFHAAGVQFGVYSASMTGEEFIAKAYHYVLGRAPGGATAPTAVEIAYWNALLDTGAYTEGTLVLEMLHDSHERFDADPVFNFVARHLDNKAWVANFYAVELGLSMNLLQDNIAFGMQLAGAITPDSYDAAIALIGIGPGAG